MSWLFRIPRILSHITAFHSLVKRSDFYLSFWLLFFFFWMCGNDQNRFQQNVFKPILDEEREYFFQSGPVKRVKSFIVVLGHEKAIQTKVRLGMFLPFPIDSNVRAKRCPKYFLPLGKVFDWFLVLELEVNYSAYHEHVCTFAYIHM